MRLFALISALCVLLVLVGCGGSAESEPGSILAGSEGRPDVPAPEGRPPTKLAVENLEAGSGPPAKVGDELTVRYFNFDYRTHQVYEDRWNEIQPFSFVLGKGEVLKAWDEGLRGLRPGGRRELIVPKKEGYGEVDQVYVIELISVDPPKTAQGGPTRRVKGTGAKPRIEIPPGPPPEDLVVRELRAGSGRPVEQGERLGVRYVGRKFGSKQVEDRWSENPPFSFVLGAGDVREGWEIALQDVKLGARLELILPSRLAYGTGAIVYVLEPLEAEELKNVR